uniref:RWP-RK domain-containing protein n=1 Tax=Hanusia phi TaxID=3032 RepID=A0A7S0E9H0_9CRYP|mmetsp:Transcript_19649/g.44933  ORF Transcript_19649/g.44933 Transcript_19649/m.44933 type:complete len:136 (+) Transcript_19649:114-521(+)
MNSIHTRISRRIKIIPRPRCKPGKENSSAPISIDVALIQSLFHMRQSNAAEYLGISVTSLKTACRRMGINKWPYNRWPAQTEEGGSSKDDESAQERQGTEASMAELAPSIRGADGDLLEEGLDHVSGNRYADFPA